MVTFGRSGAQPIPFGAHGCLIGAHGLLFGAHVLSGAQVPLLGAQSGAHAPLFGAQTGTNRPLTGVQSTSGAHDRATGEQTFLTGAQITSGAHPLLIGPQTPSGAHGFSGSLARVVCFFDALFFLESPILRTSVRKLCNRLPSRTLAIDCVTSPTG